LQPREVEEVADETIEPFRLDADRFEQFSTIVCVELERAALQPARRRGDRGERGPEIVRDGPQDGGLDGVAAAECLGLECLPQQLVTVDRDGEE